MAIMKCEMLYTEKKLLCQKSPGVPMCGLFKHYVPHVYYIGIADRQDDRV
jgi:hypothetical protein